jgi:glucose/arabinose dehydrogenase
LRRRSASSFLAAAAVVAAAVPVVAGAATAQTTASVRFTFRPIVRGAAFPTNLAFAPDGHAFYAEKDTGRIRVIDANGTLLDRPFATLPVDHSSQEMGLLGLTLQPGFDAGPWVYAYYSDARDGRNHLVRIRANGDVGGAPENLLTLLPTVNGYHNGGDLVFGTDGDLYVAVGEGHEPARAQDPSSLGGKILRVTREGGVPPDNPFGGRSPVYALGIRNSFGLCMDRRNGTIWETENGPSEWDELNRIEAGSNYGWPEHLGPGLAGGFTPPVFAWRDEIVPTGCTVAPDGSLYVGSYHAELHHVTVRAGSAPTDAVVATFDTGITDVETAPDGRLYVVTANAIYVKTGSTASASRGPLSPGGIIVLLALVGLLLLARRRLDRR